MTVIRHTPAEMLSGGFRKGLYGHSALFDGTSGYLSRTNRVSSTDLKRNKGGCLLKLGKEISHDRTLISSGSSLDMIRIRQGHVRMLMNGGANGFYDSVEKLTDQTAWHALYWELDTGAQSFRFWVNGVELTWTVNTAINAAKTPQWNLQGLQVFLGRASDAAWLYSPDYMQDFWMMDGDATGYDQVGLSDTGEFDNRIGSWIPARPAFKDYGTNGFYLPDMSSGNDHGYQLGTGTEYPEFGPLVNSNLNQQHGSLLHDNNGVKEFHTTNAGYGSILANMVPPKRGRWYAEFRDYELEAHSWFIGICEGGADIWQQPRLGMFDSIKTFEGGQIYRSLWKSMQFESVTKEADSPQTSFGSATIGVGINYEEGVAEFWRDGTKFHAEPLTPGKDYTWAVGDVHSQRSIKIIPNFGQNPFQNLPSGYQALQGKFTRYYNGFLPYGGVSRSPDTASNNVSVLFHPVNGYLSNGNRTITGQTGKASFSTVGMAGGKWTCEVDIKSYSGSTNAYLGVLRAKDVNRDNAWNYSITCHQQNGWYNGYDNGYFSSGGMTFTAGDRLKLCWDGNTGKLDIYKNGAAVADFTHSNSHWIGEKVHFALIPSISTGGVSCHWKFSASDWQDLAPAGYLPLQSGDNSDQFHQPGDYIRDGFVTGTGHAARISGIGFKPDLILWKNTSVASSLHWVVEPEKALFSDNTLGETDLSGGITALETDGFTIGNHAGYSANGNIFWFLALRKGPHFTYLDYDGDGVAGRKLAHGLPGRPEMAIVMRRDTNGFNKKVGCIYVENGFQRVFNLNDTSNVGLSPESWNNTDPDETHVTLGDAYAINGSGGQYRIFLFRSVPGMLQLNRRITSSSASPAIQPSQGKPLVTIFRRLSSGGPWYCFPGQANPDNPRKKYIGLDQTYAMQTGSSSIDHDSQSLGMLIHGNDGAINGASSTYLDIMFLGSHPGSSMSAPALAAGFNPPSPVITTSLA